MHRDRLGNAELVGKMKTEQAAKGFEAFAEWKRSVDKLMLKNYAVNTVDAGIDEERLRSHWSGRDTPHQFVEWYGAKYDLTPVAEWGWHESRSTP